MFLSTLPPPSRARVLLFANASPPVLSTVLAVGLAQVVEPPASSSARPARAARQALKYVVSLGGSVLTSGLGVRGSRRSSAVPDALLADSSDSDRLPLC